MRGLQALPRGSRVLGVAGVAAVAAGLAGCGGGERQDANEKAGTYRVEVVDATFPAKQSIADATEMRIEVRNADTKALPDVAVTIETSVKGAAGGAPEAFGSDVQDPSVSDRSRPIWVVDQGPGGGDTAYTNTWALGPLKAGETRMFRWRLTAVKPGDYTVEYAVSPGLNGKAKPASGAGTGSFKVSIDDAPPSARVGSDGEVIRSSDAGEN